MKRSRIVWLSLAGGLYVVVAFVIAYLLLIRFNFESPSETLAFCQLAAELSLIPIAIVGFILAIHEFRRSQELPDLELYWNREGKYLSEYSLSSDSVDRGSCYTLPICLFNSGLGVSVHYQVRLEIPLERGRIESENDHWDYVSRESQILRWSSSPRYVSFPDTELDLGRLESLNPQKLKPELRVKYSISVDRGRHRVGDLVIRILE